MTPCPERRILRKLLTGTWSLARIHDDRWGVQLYAEGSCELDDTERTIIEQLLADRE